MTRASEAEREATLAAPEVTITVISILGGTDVKMRSGRRRHGLPHP